MAFYRAKRRARVAVITAPITLLAICLGLRGMFNERPDLRDPNFYSKKTLFEGRAAETPQCHTIVALGSSRTGTFFHPTTVESEVAAITGSPCIASNHSLPGSGPVKQWLQIKRQLDHGIAPDLVIVEITPAMCCLAKGVYAESGNIPPTCVTRDELEFMTKIGFADDRFRRDWRDAQWNPFYGFRFQLMGMIQPRWTPPGVLQFSRKPTLPGGWAPPVVTTLKPGEYDKNLEIARRSFFDRLQNLQIPETAKVAYAEIFTLCKRHRITTIAIVTPESSQFRSWYTEKTHRGVAELVELANKGTGENVISTWDWLPDSAFVDGHHVLREPAFAYSKRLAREVIAPKLLQHKAD